MSHIHHWVGGRELAGTSGWESPLARQIYEIATRKGTRVQALGEPRTKWSSCRTQTSMRQPMLGDSRTPGPGWPHISRRVS